MEQLSDLKLAKTAEDPALEDLIHCSYVQTTDLVASFGDPAALNPLNDPDINGGIFSAAELDERRFEKTAAVMKLVIEGYAGAGTIENGGYDYHDSSRATGEIRDFLAGQMMGACLEFAALRGQQLMLYVLSDGSVASNGEIDNSADGRGKGIWRGDNSSTAASLILVYDPVGRPQLTRPDANQIGYFRAGRLRRDRGDPGCGQRDRAGGVDRAQLHGASQSGRDVRHGSAWPRPRHGR